MAVALCTATVLGGFAPAIASASLVASTTSPTHEDQLETVRHDAAQRPVASPARALRRTARRLASVVRHVRDTIRRLGSRAPGAPAAWRGPPVLLI